MPFLNGLIFNYLHIMLLERIVRYDTSMPIGGQRRSQKKACNFIITGLHYSFLYGLTILFKHAQ